MCSAASSSQNASFMNQHAESCTVDKAYLSAPGLVCLMCGAISLLSRRCQVKSPSVLFFLKKKK